jgi:hypothetical protein
MKFAAAHQPPHNVGCLQKRAFGWRMGRQIARNRDQDMPTLRRVAPLEELPHPCLKHLVGMKASIFAQECLGKRRD